MSEPCAVARRAELPIERWARALLASIQARADRSRLGGWAFEFLMFGLKQAWACLFGGAMLALLLGTQMLWPAHAPLARYDFLVMAAVAIQVAMLTLRLEDGREALAILMFHAVGTLMELFKTSMGSWTYPEPSLLRIAGVPLVSGFMYAAVGSYLARVWRTVDMRFPGYPPAWETWLLATAIYANFSPTTGCRTPAGCSSPPRPGSTARPGWCSARTGRIGGCHCSSASCSWPCSSGLRKTSAHTPTPGSIPRSGTAGRWWGQRNSAAGSC